MMMRQPITRLPPLRQELTLTPGSPNEQGAPTWVLQDPAGNRFYQLSWPAFELLSRWHLQDPNAVLASIHAETTLQVGMEDIEGLLDFLGRQNLLLAISAEDSARFARIKDASKLSGAQWLLKNYLFFRLPLVRPARFLQWFSPYFKRVFTPGFWWTIAALLTLGVYLVSRQWDSFIHTFAAYSGWEAVLGIGIALSFAKVLHECGHALTAHNYGCRVPTMGVAFLVMLPVLYTDTTDAWKLSSRRARLHIGAAGMLAELVLAVFATLLWSFLPDGPLRAGVFLLATSTWLITLAINASPFMRFDGYFLLSDWLNLPNLHERAFALGRWQLREWLFGWNDPIPELFPPKRQRFLIAFAFFTAIYRAVLFLSIALLVYHLFFKLLGLILMLVELIWFIAYPVQRELKVWWQRRADIHGNPTTYRSAALLGIVVLIVMVPWQSSINAPAVIGAEQSQRLYAVSGAQVKTAALPVGTQVKAGQLLVQLESPELEFKLHLAQAKEEQLRWELEQQAFNPSLQSVGPALRKHWEGAQETVKGLQERLQQLQVVAPFDGLIAERNPSLEPGTWVATGEKLFQIISPKGIKGEAFISEAELLHLTREQQDRPSASFIARLSGFPKLHCQVDDLDKLNLSQIDQAYVASTYGGSIPAQANREGLLIPLQATFRVRLSQCQGNDQSITQELAGVAHLQGERHSLLGRAVQQAVAIVHSEAGF